jgi:hypothetical protein
MTYAERSSNSRAWYMRMMRFFDVQHTKCRWIIEFQLCSTVTSFWRAAFPAVLRSHNENVEEASIYQYTVAATGRREPVGAVEYEVVYDACACT